MVDNRKEEMKKDRISIIEETMIPIVLGEKKKEVS